MREKPTIALAASVRTQRQPEASARAIARLWILLAVVALAANAGCLVPRSHAPLARKSRPAETVALLPISDQDVFGADFDPNVVLLMNRVLDSLAAGRSNHLMGPKKIRTLLNATPRLSPPTAFLTSGGPITNTTFLQSLEKFAGNLGAEKIVFSEVSHRRHPERTDFGFEISPDDLPIVIPMMEFTWGGTYVVRQVMIDVPASRVLARSEGTHSYSQTYGQACVVPLYVGRTGGHAVEVATREALTKLLKQGNLAGKPAGE